MVERPDRRLPMLNQRVLVRPPDGDADLASRVEDHRDDELVIAAPLDRFGAPLAVEPGAPVRMRWAGPTGPSDLVGVLVSVSTDRVPLWHVRPISITAHPQRREYVRGAFDGPVTVRCGTVTVPGTMVDLSEGGFRATVPPDPPLCAGDRVVAAFDVDGVGILAPAEVVGVAVASDGAAEVRLVFSDMPDQLRDRIRRAVFRRHRQELRR